MPEKGHSFPIMSVRLLTHPAGSAAWNMAVDEALLRLVADPVLRIYRWSEPAVSIGYFQPCGLVPADRIFVRRYTGGGLVDHAADFTYTLVFPKEHPLYEAGTAASYETIHAAVAEALDQTGHTAALAPANAPTDSPSCFEKPVKFDVVTAAGKLAGAAQRRTRHGCLHQGSILLPGGRYDGLAEALVKTLTGVLGERPSPSELTPEETDRAKELEATRYRLEAWNRQR